MLTDLACKAAIKEAKTLGRRVKRADSKGLFLDCQPNGSAYWRYKYRIAGKEKLLSLGLYPEVPLGEARTKHFDVHKLVSEQTDPALLRKEAAQKARALMLTFEEVGRAWYNHNIERWSEDHAHTILLRLQKDLFASIGHLPVADISRRILLGALQKIEERKSHEVARRSLQYATNILRYATVREYVPYNVAIDLEGALKPVKRGHFPSMEIDMLPEFLRKFDRNEACLSRDTRKAMELLMLTLVRTKELVAAEWREFDLDKAQWFIPAHRTKMRRDHLVPLSRQVLTILKERKRSNDLLDYRQQSKYLFPSQKGPHKHMCDRTIGLALFAMGYRDIHTGHGFRALGTGIAKERLGYRHEVPDRQLAHVPANEIERSYDRAKYLHERIEMMQRLADYIENLR